MTNQIFLITNPEIIHMHTHLYNEQQRSAPFWDMFALKEYTQIWELYISTLNFN
jgi:hypothetical protein